MGEGTAGNGSVEKERAPSARDGGGGINIGATPGHAPCEACAHGFVAVVATELRRQVTRHRRGTSVTQ